VPRLRLSDADRAKFGCPEFLPVSLDAITNREAIALQKAGYPTPRLFREALRVKPVIDPATGEPTPDGDYSVDVEAWTCLVWLSLRRCGVGTDRTRDADRKPDARSCRQRGRGRPGVWRAGGAEVDGAGEPSAP